MTRATTSQPETAPERGSGLGPTSADEADLESKAQSNSRQHIHLYSHGSNDWDQDEVQRLKVPYHELQSSQGDVSSIVRDAGFSLDRSSLVEDRRPEQVFDDDLTALGAQFDPETAVSIQSGAISAPSNPPHFLDVLLRSKQVASAERGNDDFIPINELELAMSPLNVYQELQHAGVQKNNLKELTASICRRGKESRQRLFAILCMMQLPAQIVKFIEVGIFDRHLPFDFQPKGVYRYTSADPQGSSEPLSFFQSDPWKPYMADSFRTYQRQVSAPVFKLSWASSEKVQHYSLNKQLVLPFMRVEDTSPEDELGASLRRLGGTSIVRKVKIHPAHYNANPGTKYKRGSAIATSAFDTSEGEGEADFAVKELGLDRRKDDQEALALKRLNDKPDPHLIRLLVTYRYDNRFHMVFPWADGNLKDLWETSFPNIHLGSRSPGLVKWIAAQVVGLARALSLIHFCPIENSNVQGLPPEDKEKPHGRHGDLKPENILWFRSEQGPHVDGEGTLKIADFGFADFHSKHSKSNIRRSDVDGITPTYRAPEYDVSRRVSPQYDIWSFGCILLEFVVWYMRGWQGVDQFSKDRVADHKGTSIASDLFHGLGGDSLRGITASAKLSVIMIFESLKNSKDCSNYFLDLLEYIQTALLRVNNAKRAKIEEIVDKFATMSHECEQDDDYCMLRTRPARRTDSGLSEIVEIPNPPSNEMPIRAPPAHQVKGTHRRSASVSLRWRPTTLQVSVDTSQFDHTQQCFRGPREGPITNTE
ncbi:kinase-like domain-containing protein [Paraphoma chrysanthemicola]|uniref:Kinase-like domain-containing protein n=1 Tax=Paraphoma chrysanthemicola TaxID=798071 RepID=A0A8K0RCG6_9PLEO|nr:kinase-like domain-containing protein [Paraphoma chrysanthemicola]